MKKKMKTKPRIFGLFLFLLGCLLATGHALAGNPTTLTVGGTDVLSGGYWTTNADGASESDYNVKYDKDSNTLTLNGGITSGTSSTHRGAVVGGTAANIGGGQADNLYFGTYQQSSGGNGGYNIDPIKWRVLENADGQLFLISDQNLDVFQYHTDWEEITWERSTMRSWLNGYGASENAGGDSGRKSRRLLRKQLLSMMITRIITQMAATTLPIKSFFCRLQKQIMEATLPMKAAVFRPIPPM